MWDESKQRLLAALREREEEGTLTDAERQSLDQLLRELDQEEEATLRPALERYEREQAAMRQQAESIQAENVVLEAIIARQKALLARVREQLALFRSEYQALQSEYENVTGQRLSNS
ncbi:MAG: hypothetical protein U0Z53_26020 [Blastocatellia bacterium]